MAPIGGENRDVRENNTGSVDLVHYVRADVTILVSCWDMGSTGASTAVSPPYTYTSLVPTTGNKFLPVLLTVPVPGTVGIPVLVQYQVL